MELSELRQTKGYHYAGYTACAGLLLGYLDYLAFSGPAAFLGILILIFLVLFVSCVYVWLLAAAKAGRYGMGDFIPEHISRYWGDYLVLPVYISCNRSGIRFYKKFVCCLKEFRQSFQNILIYFCVNYPKRII